MKKTLSMLLAVLLLLSCGVAAFAEEAPALEGLEASTLYGDRHIAHLGVEDYVVIYPLPDEAYSRLDLNKAVVTVADNSIISTRTEKEDDARYGFLYITGKKLGKTTVTVTEPESGATCTFAVIVLPGILYRIQNFWTYLQYLPYFIGMRILSLFSK